MKTRPTCKTAVEMTWPGIRLILLENTIHKLLRTMWCDFPIKQLINSWIAVQLLFSTRQNRVQIRASSDGTLFANMHSGRIMLWHLRWIKPSGYRDTFVFSKCLLHFCLLQLLEWIQTEANLLQFPWMCFSFFKSREKKSSGAEACILRGKNYIIKSFVAV